METDEEDHKVKHYFLLTVLALVAVASLVSQTLEGAFTLLKPSGPINNYGLVFGGSALEGPHQPSAQGSGGWVGAVEVARRLFGQPANPFIRIGNLSHSASVLDGRLGN
jgi:hypothetical protein